MALTNSLLIIPDDTGIFLRWAMAVNSALVLFDNLEVRFMISVPDSCFLSGSNQMQTG